MNAAQDMELGIAVKHELEIGNLGLRTGGNIYCSQDAWISLLRTKKKDIIESFEHFSEDFPEEIQHVLNHFEDITLHW